MQEQYNDVDGEDNYATGSGYMPQDSSMKKQYAQIVRVLKIAEKAKRRMLISSQNELPHLQFQIGQASGPLIMSFLYDTGDAINTGYLPYRMHIVRECPHIVHSLEEFNGTNPFELIK